MSIKHQTRGQRRQIDIACDGTANGPCPDNAVRWGRTTAARMRAPEVLALTGWWFGRRSRQDWCPKCLESRP